MNNDSQNDSEARGKKYPVTIGEMSGVLGVDVRELIRDGMSHQQISEMVHEKLNQRSDPPTDQNESG